MDTTEGAAPVPAPGPPGPDLDARYGRDRGWGGRRRLLLPVAVLLGALAVGYAGLHAARVAGEPLHWEDVAFSVRGDTGVQITFDLGFDGDLPAGAVAVCTVRALNSGSAEVGLLDVTVPREGRRSARVTAQVPTSERAVTAVVRECVLR